MTKPNHWTDDRIDLLIDLYQERPFLYNTKHHDYFDRDIRNKAMRDIAKELETTELEIKVKIRALRNQYARERQKQVKGKSGVGADEIRESKWNLFSRLHFLTEILIPRTSISNLEDSVIDESAAVNEYDDDDLIDSISMVSSNNISIKQPSNKKHGGSKKRCLEEDEVMKKAITCLEKATNEGFEDNFEIFGRYVASEIRNIPYPHLQRWAKLQIQQVIFTAQSPRLEQSDDMHAYSQFRESNMDQTCMYTLSPDQSPDHRTRY